MAKKITKPQQKLLDLVNSEGFARCSESYKPARALINLDLVDYAGAPHGRLILVKKDPLP